MILLVIKYVYKLVTLYISDIPEKPVITSALTLSNRTRLTWMVPHGNNAPVIGYHLMYLQNDTDEYTVFETTEDTFLVTNLLPGVTYYFTLVAFNDIGESAESDPFVVTTLEEGKNKFIFIKINFLHTFI